MGKTVVPTSIATKHKNPNLIDEIENFNELIFEKIKQYKKFNKPRHSAQIQKDKE